MRTSRRHVSARLRREAASALARWELTSRVVREFQEGAAAGVWINRCSGPRSRQGWTSRAPSWQVPPRRCFLILQALRQKPPLHSTHVAIWDTDKHERTMQTCCFPLPREIVGCCPTRPTRPTTSKCPQCKPTAYTRCLETQLRAGGPHAVACGLWGDAATFHTRDQTYLVLMNIITKRGPGGKHYWLCSFAKTVVCACVCFGRRTYDAVFAVLSWSFVSSSWVRILRSGTVATTSRSHR